MIVLTTRCDQYSTHGICHCLGCVPIFASVGMSLVQGLDPASRRTLWDVIKKNKPGRAIVLTTHSMEEAETLCDRLGIFVDGRLVCIGEPKGITSRYAGFLVSDVPLYWLSHLQHCDANAL